ncbi:hypothetical protein BASA81_002592 [Batrachochytrium salamandrivorans]|nr:hypothetical protein BASA81_002592 [Batrachochytrium salamandrivorans]
MRNFEIEQEEEEIGPRRRQTVVTAYALVVGGTLAFGLGVVMFFEDQFNRADWLGAMVLGGLCLIPGLYASVLAYGAKHKWPGYSWRALD